MTDIDKAFAEAERDAREEKTYETADEFFKDNPEWTSRLIHAWNEEKRGNREPILKIQRESFAEAEKGNDILDSPNRSVA